ncbi:MAG TPA: hypothetical protein VFE98_10925 [Candidatus Bathyarchaeia archaeon]|nr:hypothetical protein [Candidatus Bathyarchaeia archaeon]
MKVRINQGSRYQQCHVCELEIEPGERYVRTSCASFHTLHYLDAHARLIVEPITELERSRSSVLAMAKRPATPSKLVDLEVRTR